MNDNKLVLIDSSVWIDFFKGSDIHLTERVNALIENDRAAICGLVEIEVIPFFRKEKERIDAKKLLSVLTRFSFYDDYWSYMLEMQSTLLKATGTPIAVPDLIVATLCLKNNAKLYSLDKHFKTIASHTNLPIIE